MDIVVGAVLGIVLGLMIVRADRGILALDALFVLGWWGATAVHEIGHALSGYARGLRIMAIHIGPVNVRLPLTGGIRFGLRRALFGGRVVGVLRSWDGEVRFRRDYAWFVGGGPAISLLFGVIGLLVFHSWSPGWIWSLVSAIVGVMTLIPTRHAKGGTSDGQKLLRLRHMDATEIALMALRMTLLAIRPRDWDPRLVATARGASESDGRDAIEATLLLYYHTLDRGDVAEAGGILQRLIDYTCGTARWPRTTISREVGLEASVFEAVWRHDRAAAQAWLARAPLGKRKPVTLETLIVNIWRGNLPVYRSTVDRIGEAISSSSSS